MTPANVRPILHGVLLVALLSAWSQASGAGKTLKELFDEGHLELDASVAAPATVVPGQKLTLSIRIATDRWFTGGTRISLPEVPGLVILQTEQFATNASERRGDQSWVVQRWNLDVFPQRAGAFTIPPVAARIKVNGGEAGNVEGTLRSPPVDFTVTLPPALADVGQWVAAPDFTVSQRFDRPLDNLRIGDAFEREIVFEASDVMAMMLPTFTAEELPGLAAYPAPPVLDNNSNRGQTSAARRQRISYVVQAGGQYMLPAADFFWWDTSRGELRVLSLPPTPVSAGSGAKSAPGVIDRLPVGPRRLLTAAAGLVLLSVLLLVGYKYFPRLPPARLASALAEVRRQIRAVRKPALPERLNPGGSVGE